MRWIKKTTTALSWLRERVGRKRLAMRAHQRGVLAAPFFGEALLQLDEFPDMGSEQTEKVPDPLLFDLGKMLPIDTPTPEQRGRSRRGIGRERRAGGKNGQLVSKSGRCG